MTGQGGGGPEKVPFPVLHKAEMEIREIAKIQKLLEDVERRVPGTEKYKDLAALIGWALEEHKNLNEAEVAQIRELVRTVEDDDLQSKDDLATASIQTQIDTSDAPPKELGLDEEARTTERAGRPTIAAEEVAARERFITETFGQASEQIINSLKRYQRMPPMETMERAWEYLSAEFAGARKMVRMFPNLLTRHPQSIQDGLAELAHMGFTDPKETVQKQPTLLGYALPYMQRKLRVLERVLTFFGTENPRQQALSLMRDIPNILGYGLQKLFVSIRILRALRFRPDEVDANVARQVLFRNPGDLALVLPEVVGMGLHGKEGLNMLNKMAQARKSQDTVAETKETHLRNALTELLPDENEESQAEIPTRATSELARIMRRALALEVSRAKKPAPDAPETPVV